jgi:hypothetical protein
LNLSLLYYSSSKVDGTALTPVPAKTNQPFKSQRMQLKGGGRRQIGIQDEFAKVEKLDQKLLKGNTKF